MIDSHGASPMLQRIQLERSKSTDRSKAEVHEILSYLKPSLVMPSGKLEGQLHKLDGIKRIAINHFSHTTKKHYYSRKHSLYSQEARLFGGVIE